MLSRVEVAERYPQVRAQNSAWKSSTPSTQEGAPERHVFLSGASNCGSGTAGLWDYHPPHTHIPDSGEFSQKPQPSFGRAEDSHQASATCCACPLFTAERVVMGEEGGPVLRGPVLAAYLSPESRGSQIHLASIPFFRERNLTQYSP